MADRFPVRVFRVSPRYGLSDADAGHPLAVLEVPALPRAGDTMLIGDANWTVHGVVWVGGDPAVLVTSAHALAAQHLRPLVPYSRPH